MAKFLLRLSEPRAKTASGGPVLVCVICRVAHLGFSGPLSLCIILQAFFADCCDHFCFVLANLCGFLLPSLLSCVGAQVSVSLGKYSTEYFLSVTVPVSGCWQWCFPLPGLPGYLLTLFFASGLPR